MMWCNNKDLFSFLLEYDLCYKICNMKVQFPLYVSFMQRFIHFAHTKKYVVALH